MEAIYYSEIMVDFRGNTRCSIPEEALQFIIYLTFIIPPQSLQHAGRIVDLL
jgi:hypothetical protein